MDGTQIDESIKDQIQNFGLNATPELIAKVKAMHLAKIPEATIMKAFREVKKESRAAQSTSAS